MSSDWGSKSNPSIAFYRSQIINLELLWYLWTALLGPAVKLLLLRLTHWNYMYQVNPFTNFYSSTVQSLYNAPHSGITQACCGSHIFYHGILQRKNF